MSDVVRHEHEYEHKTKTIFAIGRNYAEHAAELGNEVPEQPIVFLKSASSIRGLEPWPMAFASEAFHHEIELVLRVGNALPMGQRAVVSDIDGLALGLDLTRREQQNVLKQKGLPWTVAKSFKGAAVLGPFIPCNGVNLSQIDLSLTVNDEPRQNGNSNMMLYAPLALVNYLLTFNDLAPGDLIFTGTPKGVSTIRVGDRFAMSSLALQYCVNGIL